jgi:putative transcriptional regulator
MTNKLRLYRSKKGVSQQQLADEMGVTRQTIYAIEKNKYSPSLELGMKIANYFECEVEALFSLGEEYE